MLSLAQTAQTDMIHKIPSIPTSTRPRHDADLDRGTIRDIIDAYETYIQETMMLTRIARDLYHNKDNNEHPSARVRDLDEKLNCIIQQIRRLAIDTKEVVEINRDAAESAA